MCVLTITMIIMPAQRLQKLCDKEKGTTKQPVRTEIRFQPSSEEFDWVFRGEKAKNLPIFSLTITYERKTYGIKKLRNFIQTFEFYFV